MVDLASWLSNKYAIPAYEEPEDEIETDSGLFDKYRNNRKLYD